MTPLAGTLPLWLPRVMWNDAPAVREPVVVDIAERIGPLDCGCSGVLGRLLMWGTRNARQG